MQQKFREIAQHCCNMFIFYLLKQKMELEFKNQLLVPDRVSAIFFFQSTATELFVGNFYICLKIKEGNGQVRWINQLHSII